MSGEHAPDQAVIKGDRTRFVGPAARSQVRIERSGADATEIRVTCPCGRDTIVVCEHDPGQPRGGASS